MNPHNWYCNSLTKYSRLKTKEVYIGDIALGADNPIRTQSMTTVDTMDTIGTVEESIRIADAGSDYVRITAPSIKEAKNLTAIKKELKNRGYTIPLIADIHFTPNAALEAARIVEKVRVNPGNYADKKKFEFKEYTDASYNLAIEKIYDKFAPLVKICKEEGTAMRIGTNHGSLSDRIMSRYGDTALGMVESALEFLRICEDLKYYEIVLSMKASNTQVMVQAYRLLVQKMAEECKFVYPLHLGVTEAGEAEDGRIKSAIGIGTLLEDGIGDTVRVSLTEAPEYEIPVCDKLVKRYLDKSQHQEIPSLDISPINPFEYSKRKTSTVDNIGVQNVPIVVADFGEFETLKFEDLEPIGYRYDKDLDKWNLSDQAADYIFVNHKLDFELPGSLKVILDAEKWQTINEFSSANQDLKYLPLYTIDALIEKNISHDFPHFANFTINDLSPEKIDFLKGKDKLVLILKSSNVHRAAELRRIIFELIVQKVELPVLVKNKFETLDAEQLMVDSGTEFGMLLIDGLINGIWLKSPIPNKKLLNETAFYILQASRTRISKTEYISCPSCGRTLFDLQETTAKIRAKTHHLKGVKIGIMGCIVNGPGEMADADYGYVGSGTDKITLYKGQNVVKKNIATKNALDELIELIKENGDWVEV